MKSAHSNCTCPEPGSWNPLSGRLAGNSSLWRCPGCGHLWALTDDRAGWWPARWPVRFRFLRHRQNRYGRPRGAS